MSRRLTTLALLTAAACGAQAASAQAATTATQLVSGTTLSTLALTAATPATFGTTLAPGATATSTGGTITATSTNLSWSIAVKDAAAGTPGHLVQTGGTCTGSTSSLAAAPDVTVTPTIANGSITSAGAKTLSGSNQTVVSATNVLLAATAFDTGWSQAVGSSELLTAGCIYGVTATYTIQ